jgi:hypothetical protein
LIGKAKQTIIKKKVSMFLLHRAKSYEAGRDSREAFHIKNYDETIQRYQRVWNQILVYVLRTASAEYSESRLYHLTQKQQDAIYDVMLATNRFQLYQEEELGEEDIEAMQQELDKHCLHICITLLDHQLDGDEYESAILSSLAAMSLEYIPGSQALYRFRKPVQYTPLLAGFLKVAKMLTIQYCWEQEQEKEVESCQKLFEGLHTRFLVDNTPTPVNWVLKVISYGRGISKRQTAEGCISWISDKVIYQEIELDIVDFRQLIHKLAEETREVLLHELLFIKSIGELPTYSWMELRDNAANDEPGWYFVKDRRNCMMEHKRWLLDRIVL